MSSTCGSNAPTYDELVAQIELLKSQLAAIESNKSTDSHGNISSCTIANNTSDNTSSYNSLSSSSSSSQYHDPIFTPYHTMTRAEISRFSRHLILPSVGVRTQSRWLHSRVLVIGAGGLGSPVCLYLTAAGVGHITIIDHDQVDESNLHRQVIHPTCNVGRDKVLSAAEACLAINPNLSITPICDILTPENALLLSYNHDIIIDCSDNVAARYLTSDIAMYLNIPLISASVVGSNGQLTVYCYEDGPCYRCVNPSPPPPTSVQSCSDAGVIGTLVGVVGTAQALEALKVLANLSHLDDVAISKGSAIALEEKGMSSSATTSGAATSESDHNNNNNNNNNTNIHYGWPLNDSSISSPLIPLSGRMITWDALDSTTRHITLRKRQENCICMTQRGKTSQGKVTILSYNELISLKIDHVEWSCSSTYVPQQQSNMSATVLTATVEAVSPTLTFIPARTPASTLNKYVYTTGCIPDTTTTTTTQSSPSLSSSSVSSSIYTTLSTSPGILIDVRADEQFMICNIPSSHHISFPLATRNMSTIRDMLWNLYYKQYTDIVLSYTPSTMSPELFTAYNTYRSTMTTAQKRRYPEFPQYILKQDIIQSFITYGLQSINTTTTTTMSSDVSISSNSLPILPVVTVCRRGVFSLHVIKLIAQYISEYIYQYGKYINLPQEICDLIQLQTSTSSSVAELASTSSAVSFDITKISTESPLFTLLAIYAGYPPVTFADIQGGLTAYSKINPYFPMY